MTAAISPIERNSRPLSFAIWRPRKRAMSNLSAVDRIDGTPAICQLIARELANVVVHECWGGLCTVELTPNGQAPVYRLPVVEMLDGLPWRADFARVEGRALYG